MAALLDLRPCLPPRRAAVLLSSPHFDHILHALQQFELTPWKMVGFAGTLLFTTPTPASIEPDGLHLPPHAGALLRVHGPS